MREVIYQRQNAVDYARRWALERNSKYYDFSGIGGDCTNFASQCIYAGAKVMNFTAVTGWYYRSISDRSASWTGVEYLYRFLVNNQSVGPYARVVPRQEVIEGDIVQLGRSTGEFYHSLLITSITPRLLVTAHSFDALDRPLTDYHYNTARFLHVEGVRTW